MRLVVDALWRKVRMGEITHGDAGMLAAAVMPLHWFDLDGDKS